jgi:hypothetical protein
MKITIVYVSHRRDLIWLIHSLQLLYKHLQGEYKVVVRLDANCEAVVRQWGMPIKYVYLRHPWPDGYTFAMYQKLIADDYVDRDTDVIWLLDSDHMLMRPAHVDDFFHDGRPIIHYAQWEELPEEYTRISQIKWFAPTEKALGIQLDREYMIAPPFAFYPDTFRSVRQRITALNSTSLIDFAYSDVPFTADTFLSHPMTVCDYETLGLYAATQEEDRYAVRSVQGYDCPFKVYWSHGPFPQELGELLSK